MSKSLLAVLIAVLFLGACAPKEKTITVPEFLHDPMQIKKTLTFCSENPAERLGLENCINAKAAFNKKLMMSEFGHCYKGDVVISHQCIDDYLKNKGNPK